MSTTARTGCESRRIVAAATVRRLAVVGATGVGIAALLWGVGRAQPPVIPGPTPIPAPIYLYPDGAPGALGNAAADKPRLYAFLPKNPSTRAAVLILPGGGYERIALGHEGMQAAEWLNAQGMAAFVLDYRVAPYRYPAPIADGVRAMRMIRRHAADYNIDPDRIGVWGFSAGGHLAATLATQCKLGSGDPNLPASAVAPPVPPVGPPGSLRDLACEPNFSILAYPVISMEKPVTHAGSRTNLLGPNPDPALARQLSAQNAVSRSTGPTFLFATTNDPAVPVANSELYYRALTQNGVQAEMHLFDFSDHGCGLCGNIAELAVWPSLLRDWLIHRGLLPKNAPPAPPPAPNMTDWPAGLDGPGHY